MNKSNTCIDSLMAQYHEQVWEAAEKGGVAYDEAGLSVAKAIIAEVSAVEAERDALELKLKSAQRLADKDRICSFGMHPYPEGQPGWRSKLGRDLHLALNGTTRGAAQ